MSQGDLQTVLTLHIATKQSTCALNSPLNVVTDNAASLQLHQLDSEVLQHAQQKAERFGSKGSRSLKPAHRSERDPFADAGHSRQYDELPSDNEDNSGAAQRHMKHCQLVSLYRGSMSYDT